MRVLSAVAGVAFWVAAASALEVTEDFSSDPLGGGSPWDFGVGSNANNQFTWTNAAPAFSGDSAGALTVQLNSSLPTARLDRAIGASLSGDDDFTLDVVFSFQITSAPGDQFMQFAFGLVNSTTTGGDRTGSTSTSSNAFSTVEFNYFPNVSSSFGGPTLTPFVSGAQEAPGAGVFDNFASIFGPGSDLGDNVPPAVEQLPQGAVLKARLVYSGSDHALNLLMYSVGADGSLTLLETGVPPLDLDLATSYNPAFPFVVDRLAIMTYQDGFTTPTDPSLEGSITFQSIRFIDSATIPEPTTLALAMVAAGLMLLVVRRGHEG